LSGNIVSVQLNFLLWATFDLSLFFYFLICYDFAFRPIQSNPNNVLQHQQQHGIQQLLVSLFRCKFIFLLFVYCCRLPLHPPNVPLPQLQLQLQCLTPSCSFSDLIVHIYYIYCFNNASNAAKLLLMFLLTSNGLC